MSLRRFLISFPIFFIVYLIQEAFVTQMRLPLGGFSLILIFTLIWATLSTPEIGALTGFGAGLMMDLSQTSPGPMGHWTLIMILAGYTVAFLGYGDDNIRANPINIVFITTIGVVASQFIFLILGLLLGQQVGSIRNVLFTLAGSAFWTAIISPLILKVVSFTHSNIFGTRSLL
ncbi:MAG: rod shape-determining protein MreD [Actinobacteria bacterium]|jgi:rod shape-determining protein MreD|nr:rod shape-determining protein MreD [Actinomycetota bacterium]